MYLVRGLILQEDHFLWGLLQLLSSPQIEGRIVSCHYYLFTFACSYACGSFVHYYVLYSCIHPLCNMELSFVFLCFGSSQLPFVISSCCVSHCPSCAACACMVVSFLCYPALRACFMYYYVFNIVPHHLLHTPLRLLNFVFIYFHIVLSTAIYFIATVLSNSRSDHLLLYGSYLCLC